MTRILVRKPSECFETELGLFEASVRKGGEVTGTGLRERIKRAKWLVFLYERDNVLAGVAALKKPNVGYKERVFKKANSQEDSKGFTYEAGWIFVEEQFRGRKYSRLLLEEVLKLAGDKRIYATTRQNNTAMQRTNLHCGLVQSGHPYPSGQGDYDLMLYTSHSTQLEPPPNAPHELHTQTTRRGDAEH
jgi:GNAT superfamily N-acetyltransferase